MPHKELATNRAESRPALYYPYIHIRDENWLKGAILGFQQVRRIVPYGFAVQDEAITGPYAGLEGPAGPLLEGIRVAAFEVRDAQAWLRGKIVEHLPELKRKYSIQKVAASKQGGPGAFQMHTGKFLDDELLHLIMAEGLAWHSRDTWHFDSRNWITMHPKFGSAMMSVLAITVARIHGLSVLTPSSREHLGLLANREEEVFEKLVSVPLPASGYAGVGASSEELAQVVITTGFDLTRLQPADILELLKEGKDLRAFRSAVAGFANRIPQGLTEEEHLRRLKQEAGAVIEEWGQYTRSLPAFAKALIETTLDKSPGKVIDAVIAGVSTGSVATKLIGSAPGLAIGIAVAVGVKMFRRPDSPLRFLSKVNKISRKRIGSIYVPQWRALAEQAP